MKLIQFLTSQTPLSRRDIADAILQGNVKVNKKVIKSLNVEINPHTDKVDLFGELVSYASGFLYYKFNKPKGVIASFGDPNGRLELRKFMSRVPESLFPVGRLDRQTTGLMIFTTDGDMANKILHPRFGLEKVYRVTVDRNFRDADCRRLLEGFFLDDGPVMFSSVERVSEVTVLVSIHEGRNRIVRRSFSTLGYEVKALQRLAIGPILLNKLEPGKFLKLSPRELAQLRKSLSNT